MKVYNVISICITYDGKRCGYLGCLASSQAKLLRSQVYELLKEIRPIVVSL